MDPNSEFLHPVQEGSVSPPVAVPAVDKGRGRRAVLLTGGFFAVGLLAILGFSFVAASRGKVTTKDVTNYQVATVSLPDLAKAGQLSVDGSGYLTVSGQLRVSNGIVVIPSDVPAQAQRGEIYYDGKNDQLGYFNGKSFVQLASTDQLGGQSQPPVQPASVTIQGSANQVAVQANGQTFKLTLPQDIAPVSVPSFAGLNIGGNLRLANASLISDGPAGPTFSFGGRTYSFPASGGANQTICTSAVTCATGAGNAVLLASGAVQDNGTGNSAIFINNSAGGNLLQLQSGGSDVVVVDGNGNLTAASLSGAGAGLTGLNASNITSGTLNDAQLSVNVALLGSAANFTGLLQHNGNDVCDASGNCSGGVTSLNTLTGALTLADSTAGGSTITINDASTSQKGIAQFNSTNFQDNGSGIINTIQDIAFGSSPTFAGLTLGSSLGVASGGTGATSFTANGILYGNSAGNLLVTAAGTSGQCLVGGTGLAPSWSSCSAAASGATPGGSAGGDLSGTYPNPTIAKLQGTALTIASLTNGDLLRYNGSAFVNSPLSAADIPAGSGSYIQNGTSIQAANFAIQSTALSNIGAVIKGAAGQTADLLQLQNSVGAVLSKVDANGGLTINYNNINMVSLPAPTTAPTGADGGAGGTIAAGTYYYVVAFVGPGGETNYGPQSAGVTIAANHKVNLTAIPTDPNNIATSRKIYRTIISGGPYNLVGTLADNTTTVFTDNTASPSATIASSINRSGGGLQVGGATLLQGDAVNNNLAVGLSALSKNSGVLNTAVGYSALKLNTSGFWNSAFGANALSGNTTGWENTALGIFSLPNNITGSANVAVGLSALQNNSSGSSNTAVGVNSLYFNSNNNNSSAFGSSTLMNLTGANNSAFGALAGYGNGCAAGAGCGVTALTLQGYQAGYSLQAGSDNSTLIGYQAGFSNTTGGHNLALGYQAGYSNLTGANNVFIGYQAGFNETGSNKLYISNSNTSTPLIFGDFGTSQLTFNGSVTVAASQSLTLVGGASGTRPASPVEGQLYYDTTTHTLLQYNGTKWMSDKTATNIIVAMGTATGCSGTSPVASNNTDGADYIISSCTSAQTAINTAISTLPVSGGTVYLMEGTYILDGSINLPSNVKLIGSGAATVLKAKDNSALATNLISNSDTTNGNTRITVSDLRLDGNQSNQTNIVHGIAFTKVSTGSGATAKAGAALERLWLENFNGDGIKLTSSNNTTIDQVHAITDGQGGYAGIELSASNYNTITNSVFQNNLSYSVILTSSSYNSISGNSIQAFGRGIYLFSGATHNTVSGNAITGTGTAGIIVEAGDNSLTGNTITGNNGDGIQLNTNSINSVVSSNVIDNNLGYGLTLTASSNSVITSNRIENNGSNSNKDSIKIASTTGLSITGNSITDTAGTGFAINISDSGSTNVMLSNNTYSGTGATSINDAGTGTVYAGQSDSSGNIIMKSQGGGLAVGASAATASMTLQGGLSVAALPTPAAPSISAVGTAGSTTWGYKITALDGFGETLASPETHIGFGNATLNATNYNRVTWLPVGGAYQYRVYRTTAGGTPAGTGLIATVAGNVTSFNDQAASAIGGTPSNNTTGAASFASTVTVQGTTSISSTTIQMAGQANYRSGSNTYAILGSGASNRVLVMDNAVLPGTQIITNNSTQIVAVIHGAASQSGDLLQLQDNAGIIGSQFNATGNQLTLGTLAASGTVYQGKLVIADGTTDNFGLTLQSGTLTANRVYTLPNSSAVSDTICLQTLANCSAAGSSFIQNGTTVQTNANFYTRSAAIGSVGGVIEGASGQTADLLDLNSFNGTTSSILTKFDSSGNLTFNQASTISANGQLSLQGNSSGINIGTANAGNTIQIGNNSNAIAQTINIGNNNTGLSTDTINIGSSQTTSSTIIRGGVGATAIAVQTGSGGTLSIENSGLAGTVQIGNTAGAVAQTFGLGNNATAGSTSTVTIGNLLGTSTTTIQAGSGNINLNVNQAGAGVTIKTVTTNSTAAFRVLDSGNVAVVTVDTSAQTLTVKNVVITASLTVNGHIISGNSSGTTTITAQAAANCTSGTPSVSVTGDDTAGIISITTATGICSAGALADVFYANAYPSAPAVVLTPGNAAAAALQYYYNSVGVNFSVKTGTAPSASTTYIFSYHVIQ